MFTYVAAGVTLPNCQLAVAALDGNEVRELALEVAVELAVAETSNHSRRSVDF